MSTEWYPRIGIGNEVDVCMSFLRWEDKPPFKVEGDPFSLKRNADFYPEHVKSCQQCEQYLRQCGKLQGCNSIDTLNFGRNTGLGSGPKSVLEHSNFRHVSKLQA